MNRMNAIVLSCVLAVVATSTARADLLSLFRFEDAASFHGATLDDASDFDNDGLVTGGVTLVAGQAGYGAAGSFAGGGARINAPVEGTSLNDFTIAFWMLSGDVTQSDRYITARDGGVPQLSVIYGYEQDPGPISRVELFEITDADNTRPGSDITIADTGWHHVVYTRTGTDYDFYLDGAKTDIGTLNGTFNVPEFLSIGGTNGGAGSYVGLLDDVAWFDNGLDAGQVADIMSGDFSAFITAPAPLGAEVNPTGYSFNVAPDAGYNDAGGELTDDIAKTYTVWPGPISDTSPLVGWLNTDPSITFDFATDEAIDAILLYIADSDDSAGVGLPLTVTVTTTGGFNQTFDYDSPAPGTGEVVPIRIDGLGLLTDNITISTARGHQWTMFSEVEFFAAIPTPAALPAGLAMLGLIATRRRR